MPSSAVLTFTDPDDYASSFRQANVEVSVLGRGPFEAKLVHIDLHSVKLKRAFDNLPRIAHAHDLTGQVTMTFRTLPGPRVVRRGMEMLSSNIIRRSEGESYFQKSEGCASFGSISLPIEELDSLGTLFAGYNLTPPKESLSFTPQPAALARFQQLHAAAGLLAEHAPAVIVHSEAAHGLEQALVEALVGCFNNGEVSEDKSALRQHAAIMRRFRRATEENPDQALFVPELCVAIGVSERTLRICCQEHLGLSPKRYLLLRRMCLARRALRENAPTATTVTTIATQYGFWQFGRFAKEYKALFGELPSATLAAAPRT
jgi:AraC-like DNA-binding protein